MRMWVRLLAPLAVVALVAGGCGGDDGADGGGVGLTATDNAFDPSSLSVSAGDTIALTNDGEALHNLTIEEAGVDEDVEAGQSVSIALPADLEAGDYEMVCEYHASAGMTGTITVG
jgi:plastocyanin